MLIALFCFPGKLQNLPHRPGLPGGSPVSRVCTQPSSPFHWVPCQLELKVIFALLPQVLCYTEVYLWFHSDKILPWTVKFSKTRITLIFSMQQRRQVGPTYSLDVAIRRPVVTLVQAVAKKLYWGGLRNEWGLWKWKSWLGPSQSGLGLM